MPRTIRRTPKDVKKAILDTCKANPEMKKVDIAKRFNVSHSVVYNVMNGETNRICTACGKRPVPKKPYKGITLTRLCPACFVKGQATVRPVSRMKKEE